jgi:hypothetical protein
VDKTAKRLIGAVQLESTHTVQKIPHTDTHLLFYVPYLSGKLDEATVRSFAQLPKAEVIQRMGQ